MDIVLAVINARYSHAALGVRYLLSNLGELRHRTVLEEFVIQDNALGITERILSRTPRIVGFSLSIWNVELSKQVMGLLRRIAPDVKIIVGGPEVRWAQEPLRDADVLIRGEAEVTFPLVCADLLAGLEVPALLDAQQPELEELNLPYEEYSDEDLAHRLISVEASRGCPFRCEFCLSSREKEVRQFNLDRLLESFERLIQRGCRGFRFIDRTFNLDYSICDRILDFFFERWPRNEDGNLVSPVDSRQASPNARRGKSFFLHFETVPDRFDANLIESLARFPAGGIQLEMGIQTLNASVGERISRKVDRKTAENNIRELKKASGVHIHADLIAGLPGESVEGFAQSFNLLRDMQPDEIQIGILKLLPGAPIARYRQVFQMVFSPKPPYEVIQTDRISFFQMQEMKRFARYYDIFVNPGRFLKTMNQLMAPALSAFRAFADFSNWLWTTLGREYAISLARQYELVLEYNRQVLEHDEKGFGAVLVEDYLRKGTVRHLPVCLQPYLAGLQRP